LAFAQISSPISRLRRCPGRRNPSSTHSLYMVGQPAGCRNRQTSRPQISRPARRSSGPITAPTGLVSARKRMIIGLERLAHTRVRSPVTAKKTDSASRRGTPASHVPHLAMTAIVFPGACHSLVPAWPTSPPPPAARDTRPHPCGVRRKGDHSVTPPSRNARRFARGHLPTDGAQPAPSRVRVPTGLVVSAPRSPSFCGDHRSKPASSAARQVRRHSPAAVTPNIPSGVPISSIRFLSGPNRNRETVLEPGSTLLL